VKTNSSFQVSAFEGATGRLKYTLSSDYIMPTLPTNAWIPAYQPGLASTPSGIRLYYAGAGGSVFYVDNPDADTPSTPVRVCFYTNQAGYSSNAAAFNNTMFVNTPFTADTNGVIYFGFRVEHTAPAPLNTTNSGFARLDLSGNATYVLAGPAAGDGLIYRDSHNCAPALNNDGSTLYVAVKGTTANYSYLLGLDSTSLATKYRLLLRDPRNNNLAGVPDDGTASPTVGPDGDVFFGVLSNPGNGSRGFLLHFSSDLQTNKPPGGFGWDYTAAIVPTNMVPSYQGGAPYLLFSKYNNYAGSPDGDGVNRIALLDPLNTQVDPHPSAAGLVEMREVLTVIGCTPDPDNLGSTYPFAVREWCINTAAVNPATMSVFTPSEDGHIYRWNLASNSMCEALTLDPGVGEPYVPTVIGPDGTVYTLNGGTMFALRGLTNLNMTIDSSLADSRYLVVSQAVTFTATVTNLDAFGLQPTGTVTFVDRTFEGLTPVTNTLADSVPLVGSVAQVTTTNLAAGGNSLGNHYISAEYSGDTIFPAASATLMQKVHADSTTSSLLSAWGAGSNQVLLTATVLQNSPGSRKPTGMVAFWDGANFLAQRPLATNGNVTITTDLAAGFHALAATYSSDTLFASSANGVAPVPPYLADLMLSTDSSVQFSFSNTIGAPFRVLGSIDLTQPMTNWSVLGPATEILPGQFQFTDPQQATNGQQFYRALSP
jgi:hypothetical protein